MTPTIMAKRLNTPLASVIYRLKKHNLYKKKHSQYDYSDFLVLVYEKYTNIKLKKKGVIKPKELEIIEYYLTNKENETTQIAKHFNIPIHRVVYILDNFFKLKYAIVESKMNYE